MESKEIFAALNAINVNDKTEKKNGLTYLSWVWAWAEFKKVCPDATYEVIKFNGLPYAYDENTGYMVYTTVTAGGVTHEMWLPVMDGANKAMKNQPYKYMTNGKEKTCAAATMFDINKTIMRCLTKNLAMFGLGLYIYAGEDLPEADEDAAKSKKEKRDAEIAAEEAAYNDPEPVRCNHCGSVILRATGKDGVVKEPEEIKEACGGLCPACYRELRKRSNEGENQ